MVIFIQNWRLKMTTTRMEDGEWLAEIRNYPGCCGIGPTEEAAANDCVDVWREDWRDLLEAGSG